MRISFYQQFLALDKQKRFALQTLILTAGLLVTQMIWEDYRFFMVGILAILSYLLTIWSLTENIKGVEWITLFILPVLFTTFVSLFYFLLPGRWISRLTIITVFAVGTYAILKLENIFNVAIERSIPLLRVAQTSGMVVTLVVVFFLSNIIFSLKVSFWQTFLLTTPIIFLLTLQSLWSVKLENKISRQILLYTLLVTLIVGELVIVLSFWPVKIALASLLITSYYYALVGVVQQYFLERLFVNTIREFILTFIFTFFLTFLTTSWG